MRVMVGGVNAENVLDSLVTFKARKGNKIVQFQLCPVWLLSWVIYRETVHELD